MGKGLYTDKREQFRELLREVRAEAGMTQLDAAQGLGRHQSYVSDCERGHRRMDWVAVEELLEVYGTDLVGFAKRYMASTRARKGAAR